MRRTYTTLFEHTVAGLIEHAAPLVREWIQRGHRALILAPESELPGIKDGYTGIGGGECVSYRAFEDGAIEWAGISAILNITPGEPGPAFRDLRSPCGVPRITINHGLTDKQSTFPAEWLGNPVGYKEASLETAGIEIMVARTGERSWATLRGVSKECAMLRAIATHSSWHLCGSGLAN